MGVGFPLGSDSYPVAPYLLLQRHMERQIDACNGAVLFFSSV